jgi:antitoxin HicB
MDRARYHVILEREAEGGYSVTIPAFPHGHTQGETVAEALSNAREVLQLEIEYAKRSTRAARDGE